VIQAHFIPTMNTTASIVHHFESANPVAGVYYIPADGSPLPWSDLRMQLQYLSVPPCYPQALLAHAQAHWPLYADDFRAVLAHFVAYPDEYADAERTIHLYAGYLLAQLRDEGCFELAQALLGWTDAQLTRVLGESYQEMLTPWLAAFCHQDAQRLQWLVEAISKPAPYSMQNRQLALQAMARCAIEGVAPRSLFIETAMEFCRSLIAGAKAGDVIDTTSFSFGYDTYVSFAICDLLDVELPKTLLPELETWFTQGHVDPLTLEASDLHTAIKEADDRAASHPTSMPWPKPGANGLFKSIDKEFGTWAMFTEDYTKSQEGDDLADFDYQEPFVRIGPKIGRNDPCTCGSGKKYKKCCGA
jgi:SEC-C motif/Protein of unknown function (DUF1186)